MFYLKPSLVVELHGLTNTTFFNIGSSPLLSSFDCDKNVDFYASFSYFTSPASKKLIFHIEK